MKKGCGLILAVWVLLVGAYAYVAWDRIHEVAPTAMIAVLGGTFAAALVGSFIGLFTGARDRAALGRAINAAALEDGRLEAVSGPIRPQGSALEGPFTGQPCVAYEYNVKQPDAGQSEFAGVALTPCAVDAPRGSVRVLGWAVLDNFPAAPDTAVDRARGTAYLQAATFERLGVTSMISVLSELVADDDGTIRKDLRIGGGAAAIDLEGRVIEERIIPAGAVVTVVGRWSVDKQGFAPAGAASMNRIFASDLATTRKKLGGNAVQTFVVGLVFFLGLHAILVPMYLLAPKPGVAGLPAGAPLSVWDERDCDLQKVLLDAGADPNESGRDGLTPLMNAAREGPLACVQNLVAAGARLEMVDKDGETAFAQAVMAGRDENVGALRQAGAKDFRVTAATGQPVENGSAPLTVVLSYIAAVHRGDFEMMARLTPAASLAVLQERSSDLPFWQSMRPKVPELQDGWMTDAAATVTVRGATPAGDKRVSYQLVNRPDGWRIVHEWFPDDH